MPRTPSIRWTNSQLSRLRSAVKSYNAALGRTRRAHPERADFLPSSQTVKELRGSIQSARELNNVVNSLTRGSKSSSFELVQNRAGVVASKWEMNETRIAFSVQERRKAIERRKAGIQTDAGILTGNIGRLQEYNLAPSTIRLEDMTATQMKRIQERFREQARVNAYDRAVNMYDNYISAMEKTGMFSYFPKAANEVAAMIKEIADEDPEHLKWAYDTYDERLRIDWVYDENAFMSLRIAMISKAWKEVYIDWKAHRSDR